MALDLLPSLRSTALVTLVAVSFSSPIIAKSDAFASASARLTGKERAPVQQLVAGGVEFAMPESWGRLGAGSAASDATKAERIGTVVTGVCPGGSAGSECADGTVLTFIAYSGEHGHELPRLARFKDQLESQLAKEFPGYRGGESRTRRAADGSRYLDYSFTWGARGARTAQRIATYRHPDGAGVVVMATGPQLADHAERLDEFLAGARMFGH